MAITRTQVGQQQIYNGGLVPSPQAGSGRKINSAISNLSKANQFAKQNRLVSKGDAVLGALGLRDLVDQKTGGAYGAAVNFAKTKGYGKKRRHRKKK